MSKTRGNVLDPFAVMEQYGIDPLRYYLMREVALGQDGTIGMDGFEQRYNSELANELGNLVSRSVSMIGKYRDGRIPAWTAGRWPAWRRRARRWCAPPASATTRSRSPAAIEGVWELVRRLNRLVEEEAPWKLAKDEAQAERLDAVLHALAAGLRLVAVALHPVIPGTAEEILRRLGQPHGDADLLLERAAWDALVPAEVIAGPPLFPRIEASA